VYNYRDSGYLHPYLATGMGRKPLQQGPQDPFDQAMRKDTRLQTRQEAKAGALSDFPFRHVLWVPMQLLASALHLFSARERIPKLVCRRLPHIERGFRPWRPTGGPHPLYCRGDLVRGSVDLVERLQRDQVGAEPGLVEKGGRRPM
jgi:hypothetical protein